MAQNCAAGVQYQTNVTFHVGIVTRVGGNVFAPVVRGVFGILGFAVSGRFAERQNSPSLAMRFALIADRDWLEEATKTIGQHWRRKNARRQGVISESHRVDQVVT